MAKKKPKAKEAAAHSPEEVREAFDALAPENALEPIENHPKPSELAGLPGHELKESAETEPETEPENPSAADFDGEALLRMLPRPAFQRITSLSMGRHWIAPTEHGAFAFVRGAATLYAAGYLGTNADTITQEELRELVKCCARGPGGNVYTVGDFLNELRRRGGGLN